MSDFQEMKSLSTPLYLLYRPPLSLSYHPTFLFGSWLKNFSCLPKFFPLFSLIVNLLLKTYCFLIFFVPVKPTNPTMRNRNLSFALKITSIVSTYRVVKFIVNCNSTPIFYNISFLVSCLSLKPSSFPNFSLPEANKNEEWIRKKKNRKAK